MTTEVFFVILPLNLANSPCNWGGASTLDSWFCRICCSMPQPKFCGLWIQKDGFTFRSNDHSPSIGLSKWCQEQFATGWTHRMVIECDLPWFTHFWSNHPIHFWWVIGVWYLVWYLVYHIIVYAKQLELFFPGAIWLLIYLNMYHNIAMVRSTYTVYHIFIDRTCTIHLYTFIWPQ